MTSDSVLRAWVEPRGNETLAAFIGAKETRRAPATRLCSSSDEARQWIETEAAALGLPVRWEAERRSA